MNYFIDINNIDDLKKKYKELVKKYHPDRGGSEDVLKEINNQYENLSNKLNKEAGTENKQESKDFQEIITKLSQYNDINIEICGSWIWLTGNTKPIKEVLKELKFRWASKKKQWYFRPDDYKSSSRKTHSMAYIRNKFGSETIKNGKKTKTISA